MIAKDEIAPGPITDGTLSTAGLVLAVAAEAERLGVAPELVEAARSAVHALEAAPQSKLALRAHEAANAVRDAINDQAPKGLLFFEDQAGQWGWWPAGEDQADA